MKELSNEEIIEKLKKGEELPPAQERKARTFNLKFISPRQLGVLVILIALLAIANHVYRAYGYYAISDHTIHWHAHLDITIKGRHEIIPAGVGLVALNTHPGVLHTHEADNIIHMELNAPVKARQVMLGEFFKVWAKQSGENKRFDHSCILDYCNGRDGALHFLVNGRLNSDYEHYIMQDHDQIEILLE